MLIFLSETKQQEAEGYLQIYLEAGQMLTVFFCKFFVTCVKSSFYELSRQLEYIIIHIIALHGLF